MGKNPAFQFYPGDWTRDMDDQDLEVEGAWIRIICRLWWSEKRGEATKPLKEWARILRKTEQKTMKIFQILFEKHIASGSILDNQSVTIISRRMVRDDQISQVRRISGSLGGNPILLKTENNLVKQNASKSQPLLLHSSSSIKKESIKKEKVEFINSLFQNIPENLLLKWKESCPGINIKQEIAKAEAWVLSNPKLKKSNWSRFLTNWMVRAQDHVVKYGGNGNEKFNANRGSFKAGHDQGGLGIPREYKPEPKVERSPEEIERGKETLRAIQRRIASPANTDEKERGNL